MRIEGSRALLTGATGGLGSAIAEALITAGTSRLALSDRDPASLARLARRLGPTSRAIPAELTSAAEIDRLVVLVGDVDLIVYGAGLPAMGPLSTFARPDLGRAIAVNLWAPAELARVLVPPMAARRCGHVVLLGSIAGKMPLPATSVYNATKFGLRGFSIALRHDLRTHNVGVSIVQPGPIAEAGLWADSGVRMPRLVGLRRPRDVAEAVLDAIRRDRAEVVVGSAATRLGGLLGSLWPSLVGAVNRRFGAATAAAATEAMLGKR